VNDVLRRHAVRVRGNPDGPPLLFANGFGCDQTLWRFVAPAFEADYRVVTFDYVGAGESDRSAYDPERYATLDGYASDVLAICDALELRDVILVAHSVSTMIAVLASIQEPDRFSDLVLVTPSPRYVDDPPAYRGGFSATDIDGLLDMMDINATGWASFLSPIVMGNPDRPELATDLEATFCSVDPAMARQFAEVTFRSDNRSDVAKVTVPVLLIHCTNDAVAPMSVAAYLAEALPDASVQFIDATGHCPHVSHPTQTIAAIHGYLAARGRVPVPASA
jgi:sigma-B regulation protein RsbQ